MRDIKFRGRDVHTDELIYGDIAQTELGLLMKGGREVSSDSVVQLIGVDRLGKEIYEGDQVIRVVPKHYWDFIDPYDNPPFPATFDHFSDIRDGEIVKVIEQ